MLTSRGFVPLVSLDTGMGPSLGGTKSVSAVTASLSNLMDKRKK